MKRMMITLGCAALLLASPVFGADSQSGPDLDLWDDPSFQKKFMGSFGVNSEIEPTVRPEEREKMQELIPLLSDDQDAAIKKLIAILEGVDESEEDDRKKRRRRGRDAEVSATVQEPSAIFDFTLANLYFQREEFEPATKFYSSAIRKFPTYRRAFKNLGLIKVREGKFSEAIAPLSKVIELGGGDGLTFGLLGYAYSSTEQYVSAESAFRNAMLLDANTLDWKMGLTLSVLKQQKYGEAVTLCEELLSREPERADFWLMQANAYIGLNKPLRAAENFEIVERLGQSTPATLKTLADIYVNEALYDAAAQAYAKAVAAEPNMPVTQAANWVNVLAQRGATEQAKSLLAEVKSSFGNRLEDDERKALLKIEARMAVNEGQGGEAVAVLEEVVALDPLDGEALMLLGEHYSANDEAEKAQFYFERASSLDGYEADAKVRLAQLMVTQGKFQEAVPLLKRAQQVSPRDDVARYLEQVERIARSRR